MYKLELPGPRLILQPLWERITKQWFHDTWDEDAPMRLLRWRVWQLGFRDFVGLDYVNNKTDRATSAKDAPRPYPVRLPVPKSTSITKESGYSRRFRSSIEIGYSES